MAPNVQAGGVALLADARVDATARAAGVVLLADARVDATARAAGIALLVDAIRTPAVASTGHYAYII